jgi:hypothetical protein
MPMVAFIRVLERPFYWSRLKSQNHRNEIEQKVETTAPLEVEDAEEVGQVGLRPARRQTRR